MGTDQRKLEKSFPKERAKTILYFFGTRPEAIKLAPLIRRTQADEAFRSIVCVSGQHREMIDNVLPFFDIGPNYDLQLMQPNQSLIHFLSRAMMGLEQIVDIEQPDAILVQGDTTSVLAGALVAGHKKIPLIHLEAGLRSGSFSSPFPEEMNRVLASLLSTIHLAPTIKAAENLKEFQGGNQVHVTGNTVIDALKLTESSIASHPETYQKYFSFLQPGNRYLLVSCHRRESFGAPYLNICDALLKIAENNPDIEIIYPVHLNPNIHMVAHERLKHSRIHLIPPLDYPHLVYIMQKSYLILTDSGGIQEEAPYFGKPVLVLRDVTERTEGVMAGTAILVGTKTNRIVKNCQNLLDTPFEYAKMARATNPYGDGKSVERIVEIMKNYFWPKRDLRSAS